MAPKGADIFYQLYCFFHWSVARRSLGVGSSPGVAEPPTLPRAAAPLHLCGFMARGIIVSKTWPKKGLAHQPPATIVPIVL